MMKFLTTNLAAAVLTIPSLFAQGPLAPPAAPGPLMKSLDQIEPRIPISSLPFAIHSPGSYYFTQNLQFTATSGSAITINASNVTLDLGGFTLSSIPAVTGRAIDSGAGHSLTVKNGYIVGNTTVVVSGTAPNQMWTVTPAGFEIGIADFSSASHYHNLGIRGCRTFGLLATGGGNTVIDKVSVSTNGQYGISSEFSSISNCVATANGTIGIYAFSGGVTTTTASSNGNAGIYAFSGSITNSTATSNGHYGIFANSGSVTNSTAKTNANTGIFAEGGSVTHSTATQNGVNGIFASSGSVTNSTARSNLGTDLVATTAVVAFCKAGSMTVSGALTGNLTP
ncbi:MAG: right-handed parallel beta-helix repeat-containing protein [Verrucomicrobiota bacterium]